MLDVVSPENLAIKDNILKIIPPRAPGLRQSNELFPGKTGLIFDPLSAAENLATITVSGLLNPERAARIVLFNSQDKNQPGLAEILDIIIDNTIHARYRDDYYMELQRTVNNVVLNNMILLAANKNNATQVRAIAYSKLVELKEWLEGGDLLPNNNQSAHYRFMVGQIKFYFENPDRIVIPNPQSVPAGAPIGSY